MQKLYSDYQSRQMDANAQNTFGMEGSILMEDASFSTYNLIRNDLRRSGCTLFVAGGGNNGGDALAVARLAFLDGCSSIRVLLADSGKETELRALQRRICNNFGMEMLTDWDRALDGAQVVVDGLFGVGLKGSPREPLDALIAKINSLNLPVISLDVPSGMGDGVPFGKAIKAVRTICMGVSKKCLYLPQNRDFAGEIQTTFPFFPEGAKEKSTVKLLEPEDMNIRPLESSAYKKSRGSVAIIGGSGRFTGAVVLSAKAAFHAGAGLVTVFTEAQLVPTIAKAIPSAMVSTYEDAKDLSIFDAVLCGPGMGDGHDEMVKLAVKQARKLVLDADGIRAFARLKLKADGNCILTPHLGEFSALLKAFCPQIGTGTPDEWTKAVEAVSEATGGSLIVKANTVWVRTDRLSVIDGQNPALGVAGSGDVLSGVVVALMGSGCADVAENAATLHQKAGRMATEALGFYSSDDLVKFIGKALKA